MSTTTQSSQSANLTRNHQWLAKRVANLSPDVVVSASFGAQQILGPLPTSGRLITATSSHLGHAWTLHASVCRYLSHSMIQAGQSGQVLLVSPGSAIYPWAIRAAELFGVTVIEIRLVDQGDFASKASCAAQDPSAYLMVTSSRPLCRDRVMIQLADQVDCVFARPAGKIFSAIASHLESPSHGTVRVAIHDRSAQKKSTSAALKLMDAGALGWYCRGNSKSSESNRRTSPPAGQVNLVDDNWTRTDGQWLVHCTRGHQGPWPGQTERQYRDELLLYPRSEANDSHESQDNSAPLITLQRILRMKRLVASSIATDSEWPVVCFSEQPLATLLAGRSYRSHLHRWDYEPYGIAIRKSAAIRLGCQPVLYGEPRSRDTIAPADQFRFQSKGKTYDWTQEREWRFPGDVCLEQFAEEDVRVFVPAEEGCQPIRTTVPVTLLRPAVEQATG